MPLACLPLSGCDIVERGFLSPAGPIASAIRDELLLVSLVMLFVILPVLILTASWHFTC